MIPVRSNAEQALETLLRWNKLPAPQAEVRFHPQRRWRLDFAWPQYRLAVEVEGGAFVAGRHVRGAAFEADCEKANEALLAGWRVLRVTPRQIEDGRAVEWIRRALERAA